MPQNLDIIMFMLLRMASLVIKWGTSVNKVKKGKNSGKRRNKEQYVEEVI